MYKSFQVRFDTLERMNITQEELKRAFEADFYIMNHVHHEPHTLLRDDIVQRFGFKNMEIFADTYARAHAVCMIETALKTRGFCDIADYYIYKARKHFPRHPTPPMPTSVPAKDAIPEELLKFLKGFHTLQLMHISW